VFMERARGIHEVAGPRKRMHRTVFGVQYTPHPPSTGTSSGTDQGYENKTLHCAHVLGSDGGARNLQILLFKKKKKAF